MALEPSTLTRTLKSLIATGWLELAAGADRRTRSVRITSSGPMKRAEENGVAYPLPCDDGLLAPASRAI